MRWDWLKKIDDTLWYFELLKDSTKNYQVRLGQLFSTASQNPLLNLLLGITRSMFLVMKGKNLVGLINLPIERLELGLERFYLTF